MREFVADLHVHTVLSPCGDLEMSPATIVQEAARKKIDILGITDHNSTRHAPLIKRLSEEKGIFVLCGAEVTTKEEIHCLAFFEDLNGLQTFQDYLDAHLKGVKNDPRVFGYQVVVNEFDEVLEEIQPLLISALDQSLDQVGEKVRSLNGLFIPAHIDRPSYSLISQLGFVPPGMVADALEITGRTSRKQMVDQFPYLASYTFIQNSDAHHPDQLGRRTTTFVLDSPGFGEIRLALKGEQGRGVAI